MSNVTVVRTKSELENAIERQDRTIAVQSASLADDIETIKSASSAAILTASGAVGVFVTNFWNPVGWGSGVVAAISGGSLVSALVAIGLSATLLFAIYNDYSINGRTEVRLAGGNSVKADLVLERR
ncbi:hypothetical protein [Idiomarina sp.]|uniref:hypothetical protein n=1 Tax=Idiomarina sp. TaxID=1874361 RepID=UPI0025BC3617|nr:hypothetical protein [Idiomarina sp.]